MSSSTSSNSSDDEQKKLPKHITVLSGISFIVNTIVSTGIFRTVGSVHVNVGSTGASILVWFASGLLSLFGAFCYVELGSRFPSSGGDQVYLTKMYGPVVGFLYVWINVIVMFPGGFAIETITISEYLCNSAVTVSDDKDSLNQPQASPLILKAVGICFILITAGINIYSSRLSTQVTNFFLYFKVGMLCLVALSGFVYAFLNGGNEHGGSFNSDLFHGTQADPSQYALALYASLWAYGGW
jgi:amino acid transporter